MFGLEIKYSVLLFIAEMKKRDGTDFQPTAFRVQLQKFQSINLYLYQATRAHRS